MLSKIFLLVTVVLLIMPHFAHARYVIQLKDFLCGCEYCETVSTSEPLDIGRHMISCHSWRDATLKTMNIMEQMKKEKELEDKYGIPIEDTLPSYAVPKKQEKKVEEKISEEPKTIHNDHTWREHDIHGWNYSATAQNLPNSEGWIYREDLEWVWTFSEKENFLYSIDYGWFYAMRYQNHRLLYWYDRKYWLLANNFWWKK
jgi:hypothetical protein